jgi:hypothetical protein
MAGTRSRCYFNLRFLPKMLILMGSGVLMDSATNILKSPIPCKL